MRYLAGTLIMAVVVLAAMLAAPDVTSLSSSVTSHAQVSRADVASVATLTEQEASFDGFSDLFTEIAREKGGAYAFELMKAASFPFGLDQHLLGHEVGDIMYEQLGIDGMGLCTHDFRNACSHTMVIGALLEFGEGALPKIRDACHDAPGGSGAYTMCFHGLGHGVLAFNAYEMERTVDLCSRLGTEAYGNQEAVECFGGAIMEIIGGGGHDPENWRLRRDEYLDPDEPFGFCNSAIVPDEFRAICYIYMVPYAFEAFGANMASPDADAFEYTFALCDAVPTSDEQTRRACFGGVGKEFIGIATGRNFAQGQEPSSDQLQKMYDWCLLAEPNDGRRACIESVVYSLYWGGERPYETSLTYCSLVTDAVLAPACYRALIGTVSVYVADVSYREDLCTDMPEQWRGECRAVLQVAG